MGIPGGEDLGAGGGFGGGSAVGEGNRPEGTRTIFRRDEGSREAGPGDVESGDRYPKTGGGSPSRRQFRFAFPGGTKAGNDIALHGGEGSPGGSRDCASRRFRTAPEGETGVDRDGPRRRLGRFRGRGPPRTNTFLPVQPPPGGGETDI